MVVLGVGDRAVEGLSQEAGGLTRDEAEKLDGFLGGQALNLARDFANLLGRHTSKTGGGVDFHDFGKGWVRCGD